MLFLAPTHLHSRARLYDAVVIMVPDMSGRASLQTGEQLCAHISPTLRYSIPLRTVPGRSPRRTDNNDNDARGRRSKKGSLAEANRGRGDPAWNPSAAPSALSLPRRLSVDEPDKYAVKAVLHATFRGARSLGYRSFPQRVRFVQRASRAHAAGLGFLSD